MGANSKIEWCHHSFNPWWGCQRVSPGCEHCYAEAFSKRVGHDIWGNNKDRRFFGPKHWSEPKKWNEEAWKAKERRRVFCASMADVFEDRSDLNPARLQLLDLIHETHWLDWLLLTKRPENVTRLMGPVLPWNVWIGTSCENQKCADERIPHLLSVRGARVRFISAEPLLGPVNVSPWLGAEKLGRGMVDGGIDWAIVGSESGGRARAMLSGWASSLVEQCEAAGVPIFTKQIANDVDRKGGNPEHWPPGNWPREFPRCP